MIKVADAKFITSCVNLESSPEFSTSEIVFLGRSNVGKSSFINAIACNKSLAKSSSTPGKTRLINFFDITFMDLQDKFSLIFVDLPGFGYAKVSKKEQEIWKKNLDKFLNFRTQIRLFVHLIDSRHIGLESDINLKNYINKFKRADQEFIAFYTKCDKLNQSEKSAILKYDKNAHLVSVLKGIGIDEARQIIVDRSLNL